MTTATELGSVEALSNAFAAGDTGSSQTAPRGTDPANPIGEFVSGQWPLWVDAGYRLSPKAIALIRPVSSSASAISAPSR